MGFHHNHKWAHHCVEAIESFAFFPAVPKKGGNKLLRLNPTPPKKKVRFFGHGRTTTIRSSSVLHPHSTFIFSARLGSVLLLGVRPIKCKAAERARLRVWTPLFTRAFMGRGRWRLLMFVRFALFFFFLFLVLVFCGRMWTFAIWASVQFRVSVWPFIFVSMFDAVFWCLDGRSNFESMPLGCAVNCTTFGA